MMKRMEKKREFFGLPIMFWGLWVTLLILWMGRFVTSFLSMYLVSDMHVSAGVAGTIVSMYGFGGIFGCLYGGALSDRFGRPAMIVIGNLGSAVMLVLLAFIGNPWIMAIALLIYGAISSMPTPAVAAYVSDVVPFRKQKRAYSLQTWAANFGFAIGPIIANQLVKISYSLMFYAEAAVLVFATLLMIVFFQGSWNWRACCEIVCETSCGTACGSGGIAAIATILHLAQLSSCLHRQSAHVDGGADVPVHAGVLPDRQRTADFHDANRPWYG